MLAQPSPNSGEILDDIVSLKTILVYTTHVLGMHDIEFMRIQAK